MKQKVLLLAVLMIAGAFGSKLYAQEDITNDYLTNADLSTIDNGWVYYSDDFKYTNWIAASDDTYTPAIEFYAGWGDLEHTNFKFSQTITLPAGDYRIAVNAFFREGNDGDGTNNNKAWIFAGEKKQNVVGLENGGLNPWWDFRDGADINVARAAFKTGAFSNAFDFSLNEETEISLGFEGKFDAIRQWCILGPVKLYKYSLENYLVDYRAKVADAQALLEKPMNAEVKSALQATLVGENTLTTSSQVLEQIRLIDEAMPAAQASIADYEKINEYLTYTQINVSGDYSEISTKINNGVYDAIDPAIIDIKNVRNSIIFDSSEPDMSKLIDNAGFELGNTNYWTVGASSDTGARSTSNETYSMSNSEGDYLFNTWWKGIPITQNVGKLPVGKYTLSAVVASDGARIYMKVNDAHDIYVDTSDKTEGLPLKYSFTLDEEKEVTIGVVGSADDESKSYREDGYWWYKADDFRLSIAKIEEVATELPEVALEQNEWYFFEVPATGEYTITAGSNLEDVVYTTNGEDYVNTQATSSFSPSMTLEGGKYYLKSSSAQTLTFTPLTYTYTINGPILSIEEGTYVNELTTWALTFNPITDDPSAAFALIGEGKAQLKNGEEIVAEGALSLNGNTLTATFSDVTLSNGAAYTLLLPAGVVGFEGQATNEAISISFQTPSIADGIYYLYDATEKLFLGRGGSWGTEAVADRYGVPFNWKTGADGAGSIEFIDWPGVYLYITGTGVFTDKPSTGWKLVEKEGGYNLCSADGTVYTTHELGSLGEYVHTTENASLATVWTLMNKEDHDAIVAEYPTDNKTSVAGAANIDGELDAYIATLSAVDMTDKIGTAVFAGGADAWTFTEVRRQDNQPAYGNGFCEAWNATGSWTQTVVGLPKGIYKLTVNGFERRTNNATSYALGEQGYNLVSSNMTANGEQVRFASWFDAVEKNGNNYNPNDTREAVAKFEAGNYLNELYVYVGDNGKLDITVNKPNYTWDCWTLFNNFTLTYYAEPIEVEISSVGYSTLYYGELNLTIPENVEVYTATVNDRKIEMNKADAAVIPAGTGVIIKAAEGTYKFAVSSDEPESTTAFANNDLKGTDETTTISEDGYKYYVLSVKGGKNIGFYYAVEGGASVENGAHKAYLAVPVSEANAAGFEIETANGIEDMLFTRNTNGEAYTISGVRMKSGNLPKGLYIIDGKKTVIK